VLAFAWELVAKKIKDISLAVLVVVCHEMGMGERLVSIKASLSLKPRLNCCIRFFSSQFLLGAFILPALSLLIAPLVCAAQNAIRSPVIPDEKPVADDDAMDDRSRKRLPVRPRTGVHATVASRSAPRRVPCSQYGLDVLCGCS
jgi:hypothetical protein